MNMPFQKWREAACNYRNYTRRSKLSARAQIQISELPSEIPKIDGPSRAANVRHRTWLRGLG